MLDYLKRRDLPLHWQFLKYGICGGVSGVTMILVILLITTTNPALVDAHTLTTAELVRNTNLINTAGFIPSTIIAYLTNRAFVFTTGQHSPLMEFIYFMITAAVGFLAGIAGTAYVMETYQTSSLVGNLAFGFPVILVNFICRKCFIFKN